MKEYTSSYVKTCSSNWIQKGLALYFNGRQSAETAVEQVAERYNMEIETTKAANPAMRKQWRADWEIQQKIDARKAANKPIPARWIRNPFYLKYYKDRNLLEETP